jgi:carboxymethylenebutenolidase
VPVSRAALAYLKPHASSTGKVGAVGFCWGGGAVNNLAVADPTLDGGVPFYGRQPPADRVAEIRAPLMLHYAGNDAGINAGIAAYEAALKANGKTYELFMYEGVEHAFNNDTAGARYNKAAADLAWGRTIAFFKKYLGAPGGA